MRMTIGQQTKTLSSGEEKHKERLEGKMSTKFSAAAGRLFDYPAILCSSTFSEEDTRSYDPLAAAPPLHQQQQVHTGLDGSRKRSNPPNTAAGCSILDHIEMGNYAHGHVTATSTDEKRDDDNICEDEDGICDEKYVHEEEQNMMGGCCGGSELDSFGSVFKFMQFHEM
jgi:hypothetical protein